MVSRVEATSAVQSSANEGQAERVVHVSSQISRGVAGLSETHAPSVQVKPSSHAGLHPVGSSVTQVPSWQVCPSSHSGSHSVGGLSVHVPLMHVSFSPHAGAQVFVLLLGSGLLLGFGLLLGSVLLFGFGLLLVLLLLESVLLFVLLLTGSFGSSSSLSTLHPVVTASRQRQPIVRRWFRDKSVCSFMGIGPDWVARVAYWVHMQTCGFCASRGGVGMCFSGCVWVGN